MGLFIGDAQPSKIFVGDTPISKVFLGDTQVRSSSRLPAEYQEVEYIQSSGTQFIDTGYLITPTTEVSVDYQFTNTSDQDFAFGVGSDTNTSSGMTFCVYIGLTNSVPYFKAGLSDGAGSSTWSNSGPSPDTNRHRFVLNNGHFLTYNSSGTLQKDVTTVATFTRTATHSFGLFCWWRLDTSAWANKTSAKLYGCKVTDNGVLQRDFIPCYRKSDSVIGLYDLVNDQFYTNAGSGAFTIPTSNSLQNINLTPTNEINTTPNNNGSGNVQSI